MSVFHRATAAALCAAAAVPASAATTIDDFFVAPAGIGFGTVIANTATPPQVTESSSNGAILGGIRDVTAVLTNPVAYPGDNAFGQASVSNRYYGALNVPVISFALDYGARGGFAVTYDGVGTGAGAAGLGINAAALGSRIDVGYTNNLFVDSTHPDQSALGYAGVDISVTLLDEDGQSASVMRTLPPGAFGVLDTLSFTFGDFEADNGAFDITRIFAISFGGFTAQEGPGTGQLSLTGIRIDGDIYDPVNGGVPEPATWAFLILGMGVVGGAMRSRKTMAISAPA